MLLFGLPLFAAPLRPRRQKRLPRMSAPNAATQSPGTAAEPPSSSGDITLATAAVLDVKCEKMAPGSVPIKGYDFNLGVDYGALMESYKQTGFQARNLGLAVDEINRMVRARRDWALCLCLNLSLCVYVLRLPAVAFKLTGRRWVRGCWLLMRSWTGG
eukprot:COSAG01_NODE_3588_length_5905_cov_3.425594_1_plen_158_part_00